MKRSKFAALAMAFALGVTFTGCGSSDSSSGSSAQSTTAAEKDMKPFQDMAGEWTCTFTIVNIRAEGYTSADVDKRFKDSKITISDTGTLTMEGKPLSLTAYKSSNAYRTYLVSVDDSGNGCTSADSGFNKLYGKEDYDGPSYFEYTAKGTDQGGEAAKEDVIDMYYSPAGTTDWFFSLEFKRV